MDPADYPFAQPESSQLALSETALPIVDMDIGKPIADWTVLDGGEAIALGSFAAQGYASALAAARRPVVAYGCNANPDVLRGKLALDGSSFVPMLRAELRDFDVAYSAHISPRGAIPGTLCGSIGTRLTVFVLLLDDAQLARLDETEPNYDRVRLSPPSRLRLEAGGTVAAHVYVSRHGLLNVDGEPRSVQLVPARGRRIAALSERQVLAIAADRLAATPGDEQSQAEAKRRRAKRASAP